MKSKNRSIQLSRIFIENGSNFFSFWRLLKKRSVNDFILASYMLSHPKTTQKCRETHSYVIFHSDFFWKHSASYISVIAYIDNRFKFKFKFFIQQTCTWERINPGGGNHPIWNAEKENGDKCVCSGHFSINVVIYLNHFMKCFVARTWRAVYFLQFSKRKC